MLRPISGKIDPPMRIFLRPFRAPRANRRKKFSFFVGELGPLGAEPLSLLPLQKQKTRRPSISPAAGKCLIRMNLPLAGREPSPRIRSHAHPHFVRRLSNTLSLQCHDIGNQSHPAGPRFEFARRGHRQKIHSNCLISLRALYCQEKNGEIRFFRRSIPRITTHRVTTRSNFENVSLLVAFSSSTQVNRRGHACYYRFRNTMSPTFSPRSMHLSACSRK